MKLDEGQLGLLLLGFACGAIALIVTLGRFIDHLQSDRSSLAGCITFGLCICLMPFAGATWQLSLIVFIAGAGFGTLDVSMNTTASQLERYSKRHMMSSFHATFSVGNLLGAFMVGTVISHGGSLMLCLSVAGALVLLTGFVSRVIAIGNSYKSVPPTSIHTEAIATLRRSGQRKLIFLFGGIAFMSMLAEGGMMDWTAVFLVKNLGASESVGAYAFGIFAGAMALGRVLGDRLTQSIGHIPTIRLGGTVCAISVTVMLISGSAVIALIALAICGLGVANMIPAVFAAAGHIGSDAVGRAMSIVKTMGYLGLLIGPALLGFVAQTFGLGVSLFLVAAAFAFVAVESFHVRRRILQHDREFTRIGQPLGLLP